MRVRDVIKTLDKMAGTSIELEAAIVPASPQEFWVGDGCRQARDDFGADKLNSIFHQAGLNNAGMPDRD